MLGLGVVLAAGSWYVDPGRGRSWTAALLLLGFLALVLWVDVRRSHPDKHRAAADYIRKGVVFGALVMAVSLGARLAHKLGVGGGADLSQRLTMVILGVFFAFTGNALPKLLTPLSGTQCDATAQAVRRFAGRAWVLAGLAYAIAWLVLPSYIAKPVSLALIVGSSLAVLARALRPHRARQNEA